MISYSRITKYSVKGKLQAKDRASISSPSWPCTSGIGVNVPGTKRAVSVNAVR